MNFLIRLFVSYPILLFSITVHEYAHGKMAEKCGDYTARSMGRLTLNPLAHIDLIGTVILPLLSMFSGVPLFGWAKPVPVNMSWMTRQQIMLVGFAGPAANFLTAGIISLLFYLLRISRLYLSGSEIIFYSLIQINIILAVFNLIPIPPLDGSRIVSGILPYRWAYYYNTVIERYGFFIILFLLYSGILSMIMWPIVDFFVKLFIP